MGPRPCLAMGRILGAALLLAVAATAQDTYKCADGWELEEDRSGCRCFLFAEGEAVMRDTANLICKGHEGWVAELDHPGINYWLKSKLLQITDVGKWEAFWLGASTNGRHSEHQPGVWWWEHRNETVTWFDWADGQPNNQNGDQDCLTLEEFHDPFWPMARDYFWNDLSCQASAHYICERPCHE